MRKALELYNHGQENKQDTTFQPLLQSEQDAAEKLGAPLSKDFLIADGVADIFAGTDTTSTTLTMTLLAIFASKPIYDKLHEELKTIMPDQYTIPSLPQFEALPYLSACVKVRCSTLSHHFSKRANGINRKVSDTARPCDLVSPE